MSVNNNVEHIRNSVDLLQSHIIDLEKRLASVMVAVPPGAAKDSDCCEARKAFCPLSGNLSDINEKVGNITDRVLRIISLLDIEANDFGED